MLKHNSYFEGRVQSIGFERHGFRTTVGVIGAGDFRFETGVAERMTVVSGELFLRLADAAEFRGYPAGTSFEVPAKSAFDVRSTGPTAYLCEFLR
jgi:uncharacterized protein YaiE (UPF0345 family)